MQYAVKVRPINTKRYSFIRPDGETTIKKAEAQTSEDLVHTLRFAEGLREDNQGIEVIVVNFETGDELSKSAIAAAQTEAAHDEVIEHLGDRGNGPPTDDLMDTYDVDLREDGDDVEIEVDLGNGITAPVNAGVLDEDTSREVAAGGSNPDPSVPTGEAPEGWDESATGKTDEPERIVMVTPAPEAYDGFGTVTLELLPWKTNAGNQYRRVGIFPDHLEWQTSRYASGMMGATSPDQFDELVTFGLVLPLDDAPAGEDSAAGASNGEPSADTNTGGQPDARDGEVYHDSASGKPHVVKRMAQSETENVQLFTSVCGKILQLGEPFGEREDLATICDYCFNGVLAPEDAPVAPARAGRTPAAPVEPQFREQREGLHGQGLALAKEIIASGNRLDAQAMLSDLRAVMELLRANLPKAAARAAITGERQVYVRMKPSGAKTVSINGTVYESMADAARFLADTYSNATACQTYVQRRAANQTANARDYILRDRTAGRIPEGVVVFSDELQAEAA